LQVRSRFVVGRMGFSARTGQGLVFSEPKSAAGRCLVVLGRATLGVLRMRREHLILEKASAGSRWGENDLIFPSSVGTPMEPRNLVRTFKALLKQAAVPEVRFHDLRHTAATLMLEQGVHPKIVQERLGHSQISLTLDTYSHVLPGMQDEAVRKIDGLLAPATADPPQDAPFPGSRAGRLAPWLESGPENRACGAGRAPLGIAPASAT